MVANHKFFIFAFRTENVQNQQIHTTMKKLLLILTLTLVTFYTNAQTCPDNRHPHAIDLGLPSGTKWACCNVGATIPEGYGGYYAWGETKEKSYYDWETYSLSDGHYYDCYDIGEKISGTKYDVATNNWGNYWLIPSKEQYKELINNCSFFNTSLNGINGVKFISKKNKNSIFLPDAGMFLKDRIDKRNSDGYYWSGDSYTINGSSALHHDRVDSSWFFWFIRCAGLTIRPVTR